MADGIGCRCNARGEYECACGVDWTPQELIDARVTIAELTARVAELEAQTEAHYEELRDEAEAEARLR